MVFSEALNILGKNLVLLWLIVGILISISLFNFLLKILRRYLLKKARSKKQKSNIKIFSRILNIIFIFVVVVFAFFSYIGSWTGFGLFAGLLTAGLGFALQRPITGVVAWVMVVWKRPFSIGDRIMIGDIRGEVYDITLTHVYIDEIGGEIETDEFSGRNIMIPNYLLFELNIINYTLIDDFVLGEVVTDITYESDLDKAISIIKDSTIKFVSEYSEKIKKEPVIRTKMGASSMTVKSRFFVPIHVRQRISSDITKEIYDNIKKEKNVEIAYPHTEIIFKDKNVFKRK